MTKRTSGLIIFIVIMALALAVIAFSVAEVEVNSDPPSRRMMSQDYVTASLMAADIPAPIYY